MLSHDELTALIQRALPGATVSVREFAEGGDHFQVEIISAAFAGKSRIAQHQLVYAALKPYLADGQIHALSMTTRAPETNSRKGTHDGCKHEGHD